MLMVVGVVAAVVPLAPSTWPLAVQLLLATIGVIAAGAAGSYVSEWLAARRAIKAAEQAAIVEEEKRREALVATREVAAAGVSVAELLRPERGAVMFAGRVEELKSLTGWCGNEDACPVWLLTGQGGVGKTRLALHLAESLPFEEWEYLPVRQGREVEALRAAAQMNQRVLLLVDYAETRSELAEMLTEVARLEAAGHASRLRVLLLARQAGEWWTELDTESHAVRDLVARTSVLELAPALDTNREDLQVIEEALPSFAAALGCPVPQVTFTVDSEERLPVLVLHAAALVAVLDQEQGTAGGRAAAEFGVLERLLGHERRLWDKTARRAGVGMDLAVLQQVIAAVALLLDPRDHDEEAVRAVVRLVPDLARADDMRIGAVVRWLRQIYPGVREPVGMLRPDLLAERHVVDQLIKSSELVRLCLTSLTPLQVKRALTLLSRACSHHDKAYGILARAVEASVPYQINQIVSVALQGGTHAGKALHASLKRKVLTHDDLEFMANALPWESSSLLDASRHVVEKMLAEHLDNMGGNQKAYWHRVLGALDLRAGDLDGALTHTTLALEYYANRAQSPSLDISELGRIVNNLGTVLSQKGVDDKGVWFLREAVRIRRKIVQLSGRHQPELAVSLCNLSNLLSPSEESLALAREAVQLLEASEADHPGDHQAELAGAKMALASRMADRGLHRDALEQVRTAVAIYRDVITESPDVHQYNYASALINQGNCLAELRCQREAIASIEDGVQLLRGLSRAYPNRHDVTLANSLINYAMTLSKLEHRMQDAISIMSEAMDIARELVSVDRLAHGGLLAQIYVHTGLLRRRAGRHSEALASIARGVDIYKDLTKIGEVERFNIDLGRALMNLSSSQASSNDLAGALQTAEESLNIFLTYRRSDPNVYTEDWAKCLTTLGTILSVSGYHERALFITVEAVNAYRELDAMNPGRHSSTLAHMLASLGKRYAAISDYGKSIPCSHEALDLFKSLSVAGPELHSGSIGGVLVDLGISLSESGKPRDALDCELQAIEIYSELASRDPAGYLEQYARTLDNAGCSHAQMGDQREALRYARKAVKAARSLRAIDGVAGDQTLLHVLGNLMDRLREFELWDEMQRVAIEIAELARRLEGAPPSFLRNMTILD
ncbi:tetratricopeptide repeat protein [Sphaerisporangium krabiense]|uniref:Tetratricopeptide (TPR) repeat protein n=1 Tax=Sphaerisporangium krabiense TaxID=763782 RepID=A0A7W8Z3C5_9ACTN|nr:tetratricopeptide repeat protein [Sphaerisporangium krabiense]MBB5626671.1 tetratricopeptide (TPR) repeat protein [Sphaerisporangium krabiense]